MGKTLKDAIRNTRGTATGGADMTILLRHIAAEILSENMQALEEEIRKHVETIKGTITKQVSDAVQQSLQPGIREVVFKNWEQFRGPPGKHPVIDTEAIAKEAAGHVVVAAPDLEKIAKSAAKYVEISQPNLEEIAKLVVPLVELPENETQEDETPEQIAEKLASTKKPLFKMEHIAGLPELLRGMQRATQDRKGNMIHGGGMTLKAAAGQTLTRNTDGTWSLTQAGASLSIIAVAGTVDDSNKTFTAAVQPTLLNINGTFYQKTGGAYTWTYVTGTITLNQPVGLGGQIFGI